MSNAKYLVLDTEATGLLPGIHGLIQLAGLALDEQFNTVDSLNFDIKPWIPGNKPVASVSKTRYLALDIMNYQEVRSKKPFTWH